jgi:multiple sugar transport system substrate-binding protein
MQEVYQGQPTQQPASSPYSQVPLEGEPAVSSPPGRKFPTWALILGALVLIGLIVFLIIKIVLPTLSGPKEVNLTWWGLWEDDAIVTPLIQEYEAAHPNVKIQYLKQSPKDYRERLVNALAQGQGPDIFRFHNSWVPMLKSDLDTLPAKVFNTSDFTQTFYPVALSDLSTPSGLVGIPLEYDALTLFINDDIFAKAGKRVPATWDDLRQTALDLTLKDGRGVITQAGVALGETENVDHWPEILGLMMLQNQASLSKPQGVLAEKALEFYTIFTRVDKVWDKTLPTSTKAFAAGKLAMYFGPSWRAFDISQANPGLKFSTTNLPQLPKDRVSDPNVSYATYWVEGVWSKSKNKGAAWDFLKFMSESSTMEKFYKNAAAVRGFGEPYARTDMASLLTSHPVLGSIIKLAPEAKSWYLASDTWDGPTGINSQINQYYKDAINAVNGNGDAQSALETVAAGIAQVLSQFNLSK